MRGGSAHCSDIADIGGDRFVSDRIGRMKVANKVRVLGKEVRAEHEGIAGKRLDYGGVITNANGPVSGLRAESLSDLADESALAQVAEFHTVASAPLRRRRGPRTTLPGFLDSSRAALKTLLISSTRMNRISLRMVSFTSSRSRLLSAGRITVSIFARRAASTFSLIPPTGSTSPRSVISPVIAILRCTALPVSNERIAVAIVTPADGPSFGMAPSGTWTWMSFLEKKSSWMPKSRACERA